MSQVKRILFLTGTRADFGKLKALMLALQADPNFELHVFVTGMHMLAKYGYTCEEVERVGFSNIYKYINQNANDGMDQVLAKTVNGLSDYIREVQPDLLIVHGDRVEALAGATVGALNNVLTAHIEGGEVSGTIDELIRHAVTKMSHIHFVANQAAQRRLIQLGEHEKVIHVIGSPDVDVMNSSSLPTLDEVRRHYQIGFSEYAVLAFHPVTTEVSKLREQVRTMIDALERSGRNYVVIYPNNDLGAEIILEEYKRIESNPRFKIFPSMRFEYFLSLLKHADFMIGNSSAGVREAPHFGVPAVNLGSRQHNRVMSSLVVNAALTPDGIEVAINNAVALPREAESLFGDGDSARHFLEILSDESFWRHSKQKHFIDLH
ncbi:MAG: UDP-N-acetylglucosamine 2-epimerase (hydrolyzing) [Gammaproteobacteria bacterium]|nr:UDP-N-acetylglucosamine 2-epimerase (hydrolyzing) [Gammaproteobacteria bacterium]